MYMPKLPSLHILGTAVAQVCRRFLLPVLATIVGTVAAMYLIDLGNEEVQPYIKIVMTCMLGLPLLLALCLWAETRSVAAESESDASNEGKPTNAGQHQSISIIAQAVGVVLLLAYYGSLYSLDIDSDPLGQFVVTRFVLLWLAVHFAVSIAPFLGRGNIQGFWQYNQLLFTRFLTAFLYSFVLFVGLSVALLAIENLFNVDIDEDYYARLFVFIAGIFNTIFFLAGVPRHIEQLDQDNSYPFGLKVFTQYVLIPLVTIYLGILYAYAVKILIEWQLPDGWVSYLILSFSVVGILAILLVYPIRHQAENAWIRSYRRFFFLALIPLVVLLYVAIMRRIVDYGFTENRYFVFILAGWLAFVALYFNLSKQRNIKILPLSLCLVALLSSFGPWGVFDTSRRSQQSRLTELLRQNNMLDAQGKALTTPPSVSDSMRNLIADQLRYLANNHGAAALQPYFSANTDSLSAKSGNYYLADTLSRLLQLNASGSMPTAISSYNFMAEDNLSSIPISNYDVAVNVFQANKYSENEYKIIHKNRSYTLQYNDKTRQAELLDAQSVRLVALPLDTLAQRLQKRYPKTEYQNVAPEYMSLEAKGDLAELKIYARRLSCESSTPQFVSDLEGVMLIRFK